MISLFVSVAAITCSFCVSLIVYKKLEPSWLRLFVYLLLFTLIIEFSGWYALGLKKNSHVLTNLFMSLRVLFYLYVFFRIFPNNKLKRFIVFLATVFTAFVIYHLCNGNAFENFNLPCYIFGSILVLTCCVIYFGDLLLDVDVINLFRVPMFWIATGLFFFYVGSFLYYGVLEYVWNDISLISERVYSPVSAILNVLLYALFSVAFLCNMQKGRAITRDR